MVSKKKRNKLKKLKRKKKINEKIYKTKIYRENEVNNIKLQLALHNVTTNINGIEELYRILDEYSEDGTIWKGKIELQKYDRDIGVDLSNIVGQDIKVHLLSK